MALAIIPYTLLNQNIYSGIIGMISTVVLGTCKIIKSIYVHKYPDITKIITELDIERRLKLVESVVTAKESQKYTKINIKDLEKSIILDMIGNHNDPIELCLASLHEIIQRIHNNLVEINSKVTRHNKKWFSSWRTLNLNKQLDDLKTNSKLLDIRFADLITVSNFLERK
ncbi:MAG: hypothetical protein QXW79_01550 [Thermoplasmata archaeon]